MVKKEIAIDKIITGSLKNKSGIDIECNKRIPIKINGITYYLAVYRNAA